MFHAVDARALERFGRLMRENITITPVPFRKAYIKPTVGRKWTTVPSASRVTSCKAIRVDRLNL
ncbi:MULTISPECIES: hypothetical protein [unclassified Bradyrhizobium]|uniref:hypothetical protein n=1 Tax=unclassified Bradyrhizobium TaxID=2631580 RepID=UPI002916A2E4|nr:MULTISPECIES: hypothetical protein [unclassified Bradyrhizobium]